MSFSFDDIIADANDAFLDTFGEDVQVIYRPRGGSPRSITAIIDRDPPEQIQPGEKGSVYTLMISVANDPIKGISATEFSAESDRIDVPLVQGGPLVQRGFSREKMKQDAGMLSLKVL